jgi:hypothetical protein
VNYQITFTKRLVRMYFAGWAVAIVSTIVSNWVTWHLGRNAGLREAERVRAFEQLDGWAAPFAYESGYREGMLDALGPEMCVQRKPRMWP